MPESAIKSFKEALERTVEDTGYSIQILHPDFKSVLSSGRIYAHWFEPGTIIASAEADGNVIIFDIAGELHADIFDPDGSLARTFEGHLTEISPAEGLKLINDKDINALLSEGGMNEYKMELYEGNAVRAYLESDPDIFVLATHPSVARAVVNTSLIEDVLARIPELPGEDEDAAGLPFPDEPVEADAEETQPAEPEAEEAAEATEEHAPVPEKKPAKKKTQKKSEPKKKGEPEEGTQHVERFDLLPLDIIGTFIDLFDEYDWDISFFSMIEEYKRGRASLLEAAVTLAKGHYPDAVTAVMQLAVIAEEDAEENGVASWLERDDVFFINEAVRHFLLFLREGDSPTNHTLKALWALICGAAKTLSD